MQQRLQQLRRVHRLDAGEVLDLLAARGASGDEHAVGRERPGGWQQLPLAVTPVLPGALPVLAWMAEERGLAVVDSAPPAA